MSSQIPGLFIMETENKGRGVFTSIDISKGDVIETSPLIILSASERSKIHETKLHDYYFLWKENMAAIALGYGSLYNHSKTPNTNYILDYVDKTIDFIALRDIKAMEEITINYQENILDEFPLWFDNNE